MHLVGNLIFLIAFGRSIENLVGHGLFAAAFVGLGALSFLGSWLIGPSSHTPIIGASGALSFLMGAYTVVFPKAKLRIIPRPGVPANDIRSPHPSALNVARIVAASASPALLRSDKSQMMVTR
jgi:membrane associated rhomboid family serine protease